MNQTKERERERDRAWLDTQTDRHKNKIIDNNNRNV
jgi:hypothetical protein